MARYLTKTVETWRVGSEAEAARVIEEAKADNRFTLLKSSTEYKTVKSKGEILDEYWLTTLTKYFTDPKEPDVTASVTYTVDQGYFPEPVANDNDEDETDE